MPTEQAQTSGASGRSRTSAKGPVPLEWAENFGITWLKRQFPCKVEIHFIHPWNALDSDALKVLWLFTEPACYCVPDDRLERVHDKFDLILTHRAEHARKYPNAVLLRWVNTSVGILSLDATAPKSHLVSGLLSGKVSGPPGHRLRYGLFSRLDPSAPGSMYFVSNRAVDADFLADHPRWRAQAYPADTRAMLMQARFNLAIENAIETNYHSEKLVDCLVSGTVPVYYGSRDISWLDERGLLRAESVEAYIEILGELSDSLFEKMAPFVAENRRAALKHMAPTKQGFEAIDAFIARGRRHAESGPAGSDAVTGDLRSAPS